MEQAWDLLLSFGGEAVVALAVIFIILMIANAGRDKLHDRRRHFDDTRGRR